MNEQELNQINKASKFAQLIVLAIILITAFVFVDENRSGNIINTSLLFWADLVVYSISGLLGLSVVYYFRKYDVSWLYRSSVSNALWWTLAAVPHFVLGYANIFTIFLLSPLAFFSWLQVIQFLWKSRGNRANQK